MLKPRKANHTSEVLSPISHSPDHHDSSMLEELQTDKLLNHPADNIPVMDEVVDEINQVVDLFMAAPVLNWLPCPTYPLLTHPALIVTSGCNTSLGAFLQRSDTWQ